MGNRKKFYIFAGINLAMVAYAVILSLAFLKMFGKDDESTLYQPIKFQVTNSIIKSYSELDTDNSYHYHALGYNDNPVELSFYTSGNNASIGTYDPNNYIYGTDDKTITITFEMSEMKLYKVTFDEVCICNEEGKESRALARSEYDYYMSNGKGVFKYSKKDEYKYIYSVSLTYYVKK